ncbi:MAG: type II secretion system protein [Terracidiphilus sp.]|jgi:type II secretory pathway pseudopilin PulG
MNTPTPTRHAKPSEQGYILVAVMFMLALLMIAMAVAAPKIAKSIQRDRELETMHRGKQYARAIKLFYKKFNAYPTNVDALVKTNEIRFLRKKYIDPTTGKDEWKIIRVGQNKAPTAFGFFGVPLGGAGIGGGLCGNSLPGSTSSSIGGSSFPSGGSGGSFGSSSTFGSSSSFGSSSPSAGCPPAATGSSSTPPTGASTDPNAANGSSATASQAGNGGTPPATGTGTDAGTGLTGQTFGGGGIMGFSPGSPKPSILVYKKKNHYNEWEFVYDPLAEQMMQGGLAGGGNNGLTPGGTPGSSPVGGGSTFGGGSVFGGGSTTGGAGSGNPAAPTPAPQPQQPQQ